MNDDKLNPTQFPPMMMSFYGTLQNNDTFVFIPKREYKLEYETQNSYVLRQLSWEEQKKLNG